MRAISDVTRHDTGLVKTLGLTAVHVGTPGSGEPKTVAVPRRIESKSGVKYSIRAMIGCGGLGAVYRASRVTDGLPVAIKLAHFPDHKSCESSLVREGEILAALRHRNVIRLLETNETIDGRRFIAIEHLEGETLQQLLSRDGAQSLAFTALVCSQIAGALEHAHSRGVVHRDLKPSNVFIVSGTNQVKVLDFGISAYLNDPQSECSRYGSVLYMSPEQAINDPTTVQSDIYQLALLFYLCYFGRMPFDCSSYEAVLKYRIKSTGIPWSGRPVSRKLQILLRRSMAIDPASRPSSMGEFVRDLFSAIDKVC